MQKRLPFLASALAVFAACSAASTAAAQQSPLAEDATLAAPEAIAEPMTAAEVAAFLAPEADSEPAIGEIEPAELQAISGGTDVHAGILSTQELNATNSDNVIGGSVYSGDIDFSDAALSGFSGVGNFVINTGAQNNLQGSITINILTAAP